VRKLLSVLAGAGGAPFGSVTQTTTSQNLLLPVPLSERELEILRLIAGGLSNQEIAEKLVVTLETVKWHVKNVYRKLDVGSRTQALARSKELQLL
jgi:LuxR family maltose regulon positive regulatory protein